MRPVWRSLRCATGNARCPGTRNLFHSSPRALRLPGGGSPDEGNDAPSPKVLKIVEDIANLTLLEAADMSLLLKKRLRIQNVPVMSMGMNVMHDVWYDPLPLAGPPPPPPPPSPRPPAGSMKTIFPQQEVHHRGLLSSDLASRQPEPIRERDAELYQMTALPSDNDTDSYDNEHERDHDEFCEEEEEDGGFDDAISPVERVPPPPAAVKAPTKAAKKSGGEKIAKTKTNSSQGKTSKDSAAVGAAIAPPAAAAAAAPKTAAKKRSPKLPGAVPSFAQAPEPATKTTTTTKANAKAAKGSVTKPTSTKKKTAKPAAATVAAK